MKRSCIGEPSRRWRTAKLTEIDCLGKVRGDGSWLAWGGGIRLAVLCHRADVAMPHPLRWEDAETEPSFRANHPANADHVGAHESAQPVELPGMAFHAGRHSSR